MLMDRKTKKWIIILAAVVIAGLVSYCLAMSTGGGTVAVISIDGEEYEQIDLSKVTESTGTTLYTSSRGRYRSRRRIARIASA